MCEVKAKAKFNGHDLTGQEGTACPFQCRYYGDELPAEGMLPADYHCRDD
jgi:hypothetical protein